MSPVTLVRRVKWFISHSLERCWWWLRSVPCDIEGCSAVPYGETLLGFHFCRKHFDDFYSEPG